MATGAQPQEHAKLNLETSLPDWCALDWRQTLVCAAFVLLFTWLAYLPVTSEATWQSVTQGKFAADNIFDASMTDTSCIPFADGLRSFRIGSIGTWIIWNAQNIGGAELLSFGFALSQTVAGILWAWLFFRSSRRWWAILLVPIVMFTPWQSSGLSTACFGHLCMAVLLLCTTWNSTTTKISFNEMTTPQWIASVAIMWAWANLDTSFVFGWAVLAIFAIAHVYDCIVRREPLFSNTEFKSRLVLFEAAVVVSLLNPQGWGLWQAMFWMPDHPVWLGYGGWHPLTLSGWVGTSVIAIGIFWLSCSRKTQSIETIYWMLPLVAIAILCCSASTIAVLALPLLWTAVSMLPASVKRTANIKKPQASNDEAPTLRFALTLLCALLVWLGFAFSPFAHHLLGGQGRSEIQRMGKSSPHAALAFLASHLDSSKRSHLVWCPRQWSDRCLLECESTKILATSRPHLVPDQVNADYETIYAGQHGWRKLLDRYTVDIVLVDVRNQERLMHNMRAKPGEWKRIYEDPVSVIWQRGKKR